MQDEGFNKIKENIDLIYEFKNAEIAKLKKYTKNLRTEIYNKKLIIKE
jgi:hypothetical protein